MARIAYKTHGNPNPQGKPRVWFCAHPDDYKAFLDTSAEEILKKQDCAVYYDEEPIAGYDEKEFFFELGRMNLFIMPVTYRLLHTKNRALDVEFRYAVTHHIPVLPIMRESGLIQDFNKICGDLQVLDPSVTDITAIPYDEKLTKFLQSVLIGNELAEKIRRAFDAYIFLSYRKKDRQYAQELMRLIHKNDFFRDIAIWYDEFLTPGENFNDAISAAMQKSELFALAVTPNLVNEKNYVMTVEYPEAKKASKTILPVIMKPTRRWQLKWHYKNIPDPIDIRDASGLSEALENALRGIAIRKNDGDPEHNFFIGLAYLSGIDVETDHAYALTLIEGAANAELPEAMEKLVTMYRTGEGVARDYNKAIAWQTKLVAYRKAQYEQTREAYDAYRYIVDIWDLGDYIYELRQLTEAHAVYTEMSRACEEMDTRFATNGTRRNLSVSYNKLGNIAKAQGKLDEALAYFEQVLAIAEAIARETGTVEARRDLSISYNNLGDIAKAQGKLDEAQAYFEQGLAIREALAHETGTMESYDDLAISYIKMSFVVQNEKQEGYLKQALSIWTQLAEQCPSIPVFAKRRDIVKAELGIQ